MLEVVGLLIVLMLLGTCHGCISELSATLERNIRDSAAIYVSEETSLGKMHVLTQFFEDPGTIAAMHAPEGERLVAYKVTYLYSPRPPSESVWWNMRAAIAGKTCTITISSGQLGDSVKYAKAADAGKGAYKDMQDPTTATVDLEKGSYCFQAWRQGKLVGEKKSVDCTGKEMKVEIPDK